MIKILISAILALSASAATASEKPQTVLSATDNEAVEKLVAPIFSNLKAGNATAAVGEFLGRSPMFAGKKQEMQYLVSQIDGTFSIYGKISDCSLASLETKANLAQSRQYLCQHENFVTRWVVIVAKTSNGWGPVSLRFDDNIMSDN